tara:strand:+ start:6 stop:890 length:885 start_codon:yes stop_codon:yes gene_type:complete
MNRSSLIIKKINFNEIKYCCLFLKKNLKINMTLDFYRWRYFSNGSCAFIVKFQDNIIGHVGFTKQTLNFSNQDIYLRHSSCVDFKFRRLGVYSNLINYAFNYLKKKTNFIVTWPNALNLKTSKKTNYHKIKREYVIYTSPGESKFQNHVLPLKRYNQISSYLKYNDKNGIILKNSKYFKWRYFSNYYIDHQTYFYECEKSLFLFSYNNLNKELNLLDYIGSKNKFYKNLQSISWKIRFNFWSLKNTIMQIKLSKLKFKKTNKKINNEIIFLSKKKIKNNHFFFMSDTDSFINLK